MLGAPVAVRPASENPNSFIRPVTIFTIPVDRDTIFSNHKGIYKKRIENRQRKLIVKSTFIKSFLHPGERIRCLTTGYSPISVLEQALTGPSFLFFKRALLIFTDSRILHVPTRFNRSARGAISQIRYESCARLDLKGRSLRVLYKNGMREVFPYVGRMEKKKLRVLISELCLSSEEAGRMQGRDYLCPRCTQLLPKAAKSCRSCKLTFKTAFKAKLFSILIPGGGLIYARYRLPGAVMALLETALIAFVVFQGMRVSKGLSVHYGWAALAVGGLVIEKLISAFHAMQLVQDYVTEEKEFSLGKT